MEEDPAFYKKFSEMLKETIKDYEEHRISEKEYLNHVRKIMEDVLNHNDEAFPNEIKDNDVAKALYGISNEFLESRNLSSDKIKEISVMISLEADQIIRDLKIINRQNSKDIINKMKISISDMIYDEVKTKYNLSMSLSEIDLFVDKCI
jgi:type I restriction enzyme R subunit